MSSSFGTCPICGSDKVQRSRRKGLKERLLKMVSKKYRFYRCHTCETRFRLDGNTGNYVRLK